MTKKISLVCHGKKIEINPLMNTEILKPSSKKAELRAPGQGAFEISAPTLSSDEINGDGSVLCKTDINGKNIGQVYLETMLQVGHFMVGPIQKNFLHAPKNREIKGIVHPHWAVENEIEFELKPSGRLLYCGEGFTLACMTPERYGVEPDAQIWSLEGIYQRGGGEPFRVKLEFDNQGDLVHKTGFYPTAVNGEVAPFELLIEEGDTFEPFITLIDEKGEISTGTVNPIMLGGGNQLQWQRIDACPGMYHVGVVVDDFDGQSTRARVPLMIK